MDLNQRSAVLAAPVKCLFLIDDGSVIWDSLAICEYISDAHLDGKGYPENLHDRALARSVSSEMHSGFFNIREKMPLNCRATDRHVDIDDELKNEIERIDAMWCELRDQFSHKGPWLLGQFSIADCMYAPVALRFRTYGVTLSEAAENYKSHVLQDANVQQWAEAGAAESEVISLHEVG